MAQALSNLFHGPDCSVNNEHACADPQTKGHFQGMQARAPYSSWLLFYHVSTILLFHSCLLVAEFHELPTILHFNTCAPRFRAEEVFSDHISGHQHTYPSPYRGIHSLFP
jgi:hypothetical protein